jgi:chromosomal replication initiation ATPase DnaA
MEHVAFLPQRAQAHRQSRHPAPDYAALALLVAGRFGVPPTELRSRARGCAAVAFARQVAMYLAHVSFGANYTEVGRAFGRDRTTAAHACRLVEERRDDPRLEAVLDQLERDCCTPRKSGLIGGRR